MAGTETLTNIILHSDSYFRSEMGAPVTQIVHLKKIASPKINLLFEIHWLHAIHIIPIDPTNKSSLSSAVQFVILSIIAAT